MVGSMMLPIQRVTPIVAVLDHHRTWRAGCLLSASMRNVVYEQAAYGWICAKLALLIFLSLRMFERAL